MACMHPKVEFTRSLLALDILLSLTGLPGPKPGSEGKEWMKG